LVQSPATGRRSYSAGKFSIDDSPRQRTLQNDFTMVEGSPLTIEVGGTGPGLHSQLDVQGQCAAGGTLDLRLINGSTPTVGSSFLIFNGSTPGFHSGTVTNSLGGGLSWDTSALSLASLLVAVPEPSVWSLAVGAGALLFAGPRPRGRPRQLFPGHLRGNPATTANRILRASSSRPKCSHKGESAYRS
jgi:hypothetical protein